MGKQYVLKGINGIWLIMVFLVLQSCHHSRSDKPKEETFIVSCSKSHDIILKSISQNSNNKSAPYCFVWFFNLGGSTFFNVWWQQNIPEYFSTDSAIFRFEFNQMYFNSKKYSNMIFIKDSSLTNIKFPDIEYIFNNNMINQEKLNDSIDISNGNIILDHSEPILYTFKIHNEKFIRVKNMIPRVNYESKLKVLDVDTLVIPIE